MVPAARIAPPMHPYLRILVIALVAMIIAGALVALALAGRNTMLSVFALLAAGLVAVVMGGLLFVQSWVWSQRLGGSGRRHRPAAHLLPRLTGRPRCRRPGVRFGRAGATAALG